MRNTPWQSTVEHSDVDAAWNCWKSIFLKVLEKHAPVKTFRPRRHHLPWIDDEVRGLMQERDWMYRTYIRTRDRDVWSAFKRLRNLTTSRLREAKTAHFATVCRNTNQPKKMWMELKTLMKKQHREPIQTISTKDGEVRMTYRWQKLSTSTSQVCLMAAQL